MNATPPALARGRRTRIRAGAVAAAAVVIGAAVAAPAPTAAKATGAAAGAYAFAISSPSVLTGPSPFSACGMFYYDFRFNTSDPATLPTTAFLIHSHDGGRTWVEDQLSTPFDLKTAPATPDGLFIGDYQGLTVFTATTRAASAQWLALRRSLRAGWWLPATCLGWAVSGVATGALSGVTGQWDVVVGPNAGVLGVVVAAVAGCILVGLVPSTAQWLVLRRQIDGAGWWPAASLGGFLVGFGGGFAVVRWGMVNVTHWLRPEDFPSAKALVLVGAVTGTLYAAVTWPALTRLLLGGRTPNPGL